MFSVPRVAAGERSSARLGYSRPELKPPCRWKQSPAQVTSEITTAGWKLRPPFSELRKTCSRIAVDIERSQATKTSPELPTWTCEPCTKASKPQTDSSTSGALQVAPASVERTSSMVVG